MKPWSCGSIACFPPAAIARFTRSSTSARLAHESEIRASVWLVVSQICLRVNALNLSRTSSIAYASSETIMQVAVSSVNCGLNGEAE
jgi:hypothetical protein